MTDQQAKNSIGRFANISSLPAAAVLSLAALSFAPLPVVAGTDIQAGTLVCKGDGGWGAIITSKKSFDCTFSSADGTVRGTYKGVIRKYGLDLGVTGDTTLAWLVFGPAETVGDNFKIGSLAGEYAGAGIEATAIIGIGANALIGGGDDSFALQPISVQVQTGISIAAAVQTFTLDYVVALN